MNKTQEILNNYNKLTISSGKQKYSFPAFLEDSDISYDLKQQQLPFAPVSFTNDSMALRVLENVKFTFNVFSHNEKECTDNWNKFKNLREIIKPRYLVVNEQLVPKIENVTGFITIEFNGMPHNRSNIDIHLTSFSYLINKELGYLEKNESLIPIGFKISIEGKVLLPLEETISANVLSLNQSGTSSSGASAANSNTQTLTNLEDIIKAYENQLANNGAGYVDSNGKFRANLEDINDDEDKKQLFAQYTDAIQKRNSIIKK